jgi:hypothetical protein
MPQIQIIQRKDLIDATGAFPHIITYLTLTKRLPLLHKATGKGDVNIYSPEAVEILKDYMEKRKVSYE